MLLEDLWVFLDYVSNRRAHHSSLRDYQSVWHVQESCHGRKVLPRRHPDELTLLPECNRVVNSWVFDPVFFEPLVEPGILRQCLKLPGLLFVDIG